MYLDLPASFLYESSLYLLGESLEKMAVRLWNKSVDMTEATGYKVAGHTVAALNPKTTLKDAILYEPLLEWKRQWKNSHINLWSPLMVRSVWLFNSFFFQSIYFLLHTHMSNEHIKFGFLDLKQAAREYNLSRANLIRWARNFSSIYRCIFTSTDTTR